MGVPSDHRSGFGLEEVKVKILVSIPDTHRATQDSRREGGGVRSGVTTVVVDGEWRWRTRADFGVRHTDRVPVRPEEDTRHRPYRSHRLPNRTLPIVLRLRVDQHPGEPPTILPRDRVGP